MKKSFSISPRVLSHLGEDLIKNETIALLELVKNSYDACSDYCNVKFITKRNSDHDLYKIILSDSGFGMDRDIIENVWLTIGTDYKSKRIEPNKCGRVPLGEKGIGRLGIHKLGSKIKIITKKENSPEFVLTIDWSLLNNAKKFDDFTIDFKENRSPKDIKNSGTKIIIEDLKTSWSRTKLREVYRALNTLNSPFSSEDETFKVNVTSNSKNLFEGLPSFTEIKDNAMYTGFCKMEGSKITEFNYKFKPWGTLTKLDKGREVKTLAPESIELVSSRDNQKRINLDTLGIGPVEFEILIFEKDANIINYSNVEKTSLTDYMKGNSGIRIYRDNIRVYDYGDKEDDWLGLNLKRLNRVGGNISTNIVIGSVKLNRSESTALIEKTNREGFLENDAYYGLVDAIKYVLSIFVKERTIDKTLLVNLYKKYKHIEPVLSELHHVIEIVNEKVSDNKVKKDILYYLDRVNIEYKQVKEVFLKSANAGLNMGVAIHEIEKLIASLTGSLYNNDLLKATNISKSLDKIVRGYSTMMKKSSMRKIPLSKIVNIALDNFEFRFKDHQITINSNYKESNLTGYLAEAESTSMLTNLLDNAIYWLSFARKDDRRISILITDEIKGYHSIIVSDNGPGFNMPFDVATEVFVTGKPHSIGSGLGLHISKEMIHAMGGKLMFFEEEDIDFDLKTINNNITKAIVGLCFKIEKEADK